MKNDIDNGFAEYRRYILREFERLNVGYEELRRTLEDVRRDDLPAIRQELREEIRKMKREILVEINPSSKVQAANITGKWLLYATLASSITAIVVAIIALRS